MRDVSSRPNLPQRTLPPVPGFFCLALTAALAFSAADACAASLQASLGLTSDYVHRGLSQSSGEPAVQLGAGLRWTNGFEAGVWGSTLDTSDDPDAGDSSGYELDALLGWSVAVDAPGDWVADLGIGRYLYLGDARVLDYDYTEFSAGLSYRGQLRAALAWAPDRAGYAAGTGPVRSADAYAYELSVAWPLPRGLRLSGGLGYHDLDRVYGLSYRYWSAGIGWHRGRYLIELTRFGTEGEGRRRLGEEADGRTALTVVARFGKRW